jgi:ribonuclease J
MTSVDFFGGVDEIGGNKVLVKGDDGSLFLDFGMSFSISNKFFSEFLQPRQANGLMDFMELGLLPDIKGIYREDYLRHCGLTCQDEPSVDGVLISHAHMDHSAYIHHLREDIPIYLTEQSNLILKTIEETAGSNPFSDMLNLKRKFHLTLKKKIPKEGPEHKRLEGKEAKIKRDIRIIEPYKEFHLTDNIKVKSLPVDHSLPGATAYLVETDDDALVYTGDLRFHGRRQELTGKFVNESKKFNPTTIITEGTRIDKYTNVTEESIERTATKIVSQTRGLVIVSYPIRDLDRFLTFYNVAKNTDRTIAVSLKQAYMLNLFNGNGYPKIDELAIYLPRSGWGMIGDEYLTCVEGNWLPSSELHPYHTERDYNKSWQKEFLKLDNVINYKNLQDDPEDYIFGCDFFELKELIDIKPEKGIYIYSKTEPFNEEMEIDFQQVENWINYFNLQLITDGMHGSGHANGVELLDMLREISPEKVYPIHTEKKEMFSVLSEDGIEVVYPKLS